MNQKSELGKGLKALLSNISSAEDNKSATSISPTEVNRTDMIPISQISANKRQPRNEFEENLLEELAQSIRSYGIIQPLTVREIAPGQYQIISGERRYRAALMAGLTEVPCYLRKANDGDLLELALVENIQREDLNPIEIAVSYQRLMDELNYTHEQLAEKVGKKRSTVSNYVRLLKLPTEVQDALRNKSISMGHARVLAGIGNPVLQLQLFKEIKAKDISVREAEHWMSQRESSSGIRQQTSPGAKGNPSTSDHTIKPIEDRLSECLGTKVTIQRNPKGQGKIIIPFKSDAQLNEILDQFDERAM